MGIQRIQRMVDWVLVDNSIRRWGFQQCGVDDGLQQFAIDVTIDVGVRASVLWKGSWD